MKNENTFRQIASISAIVSAPLALLSVFIAVYAVGFNFELMDDPVGQITLGASVAELFRWGWIFATFGFYLLLVPAALYLWSWLKPKNPELIRMYTIFGLSYIFIGAISLITMTFVLAPMMSAYAEVLDSQRNVYEIAFQAIANLVFLGLGTLSFILGGLWWLGIGLIMQNELRSLGIVTVILGMATLGSAAGYLFNVDLLARLEIFSYFLGPIWALWLGIVIARGAGEIKRSLETAVAS
jgi:hypothetical protein